MWLSIVCSLMPHLGSGCILCAASTGALARRARALTLGTTTVALGLAILGDDLQIGRLSSGTGVLLVWVLAAASASACARGTWTLSRLRTAVACVWSV
jgi:hypothetical protein